MEKKGDLLNQLAIISDLIEKTNANIKSNTVVFEVSSSEFNRIYTIVQKKYGKTESQPKNSFSIKIGEVDFVFNTNNV